jgi:hypothetical protein
VKTSNNYNLSGRVKDQKKMPVSAEDISVLIQGGLIATPGDRLSNSATLKTIQSVRAHLPEAEIVLSTWEGSDTGGLECEHIVLSKDPGSVKYHNSEVHNNTARQIVATQAGLACVSRPYTLKLRTDAILTHGRFLKYFDLYKKRCDVIRILENRVLVSMIFSHNADCYPYTLFCPSDWFQFGLSSDIRMLWDIPLPVEPDNTYYFLQNPRPEPDYHPKSYNRYHPEQYLWLSFLRKHTTIDCKHHSDVSVTLKRYSELSLTNNLQILNPWQSGIISQSIWIYVISH